MTRKSARILLAFVLCCCLFFSLSQDRAINHQLLLEQYQAAEQWYNKATAAGTASDYNEEKENRFNQLALDGFKSLGKRLERARPSFDSLLFFTRFRTGELEHFFESYNEALLAYNHSISIHKKTSLPDSLLFKPYLYAGIIYYNQNRYDTAAHYFQKAEIVQAGYDYSLEENERLYNMLGVLLYEKGDYRQAGNYFEKALEVLSPEHPYFNGLSINYQINLGQIHMKLEEYDQANKIYQHLLQHPSNAGLLNEIYHSIGSIHLRLGAPRKALEYFEKARYSGNKKIRLANSKGQAYLLLEEYETARKYFDSALIYHRQLGVNSDPVAYGQTNKHLGDLELATKSPLLALEHYQLAIRSFFPAFTDASHTSNPAKYSGLFSYINLFNTLIAKAGAFHVLYEKENNISWAQQELSTYQSAFKLMDYVQRTYNSDESRLFIDQAKYEVHAKPIDIAYELYRKTNDAKYLEALYVFDQQNKATVLAMQQLSGKKLVPGDSSLILKEKQTRSEISRLALKAAQLNDSIELAKYQLQIRDLEIELGSIRDDLHLPDTTYIPPSMAVRDLLEKNTQLISYHLSYTHLTTILISRDRFEVFQDSLQEEFHESLDHYIHDTRSFAPQISEQAKALYKLLFRHTDPGKFERFIIIPDDDLLFLSFESLVNEGNEYLVQQSAIQYQYATTLLNKEELELANYRTLAMSPFSENDYRDSNYYFEKLPLSQAEVKETRGKQYIGNQATKRKFYEVLEDYPVIHLATHAAVDPYNDDLSFIAFSPADQKDFLLFAKEIQHLPLRNTRMVILSACETGLGTLVKGEGIMSLSRAFYYAGCENIVTTFWKANDFSTAYITARFHHYLDESNTIDIALQKAKKDYLADPSINPRMKHPHYWSHLVFIGNHTVVKKQTPVWVWLAAGTILLLAIIILIKKARRPGQAFHR